MGDLVGVGKFPAHNIISNSCITNDELPENVSLIPTELNMQDAYETEVVEFQEEVREVIEEIIKNGIVDFLDSINKINNPKTREAYEKETEDIFREMYIKANAIDDTFNYIEDEFSDSQFTNEYVISVISDLLSIYRDEVFDLLVKKFKKNK